MKAELQRDLFKTEEQADLYDVLASSSSLRTAAPRLETYVECAQAIDALFQDSLRTNGSNALMEYLEFARKLSNLSIYNAMLVRVQRPGTVAVTTRKKWLANKRVVRPGAIPIVTLRPFGPVSFLYEVSDTVGPPLRDDEAAPFKAEGEMSLTTWATFKQMHASKNRIRIEEANFGEMLAGTAQRNGMGPMGAWDADSSEWLIRLNAKHSNAVKFATLTHELGHIFCGHCGASPTGSWASRTDLPREVVELEAEAVSYLVCTRRGIKSDAADYLNRHIKSAPMDKVSMHAIYTAANRVEG